MICVLLPGPCVCGWCGGWDWEVEMPTGEEAGRGPDGRVLPSLGQELQGGWPSLTSWVSLGLHCKEAQPDRACHGGRWFDSGPEDLSPSLLLALPHDLGPSSHKSSGLPQIKGSRWASAGSSFLCLSGFVKYLKCQGPWEPA